jgi:hypothetical protein
MATDTTPIDIRWRLNVARLVTVLLLFVLARVFEEGARMPPDLEGTCEMPILVRLDDLLHERRMTLHDDE